MSGRKNEERINKMNALKNDFLCTWNTLECIGNAEEAFQFLNNCYSSPFRCYHTMLHIRYCLNALYEFSNYINKFDLVRFALFYHDIVHDIFSNYNEELSIRVACSYLPKIYHNTVYNLIMATIYSKERILENDTVVILTDQTNIELDNDAKIMADIDVSVFGLSSEKYQSYEYLVRQEYAFFDKATYNTGRIHILESFLNRYPNKKIYHTKVFRKYFSEQSQENLIKSIERLKKK